MQITAIHKQKKRNKVNIFIDEKFAFSLDYETLLKYSLSKGVVLSEEKIRKIVKDADFAKWYSKALDLISRRPRSEKEIHDYLRKKAVGDLLMLEVTRELKERKFIDDTAFAFWFVDQRVNFRPKGKRALLYELKQKGISEDIINTVFSDNKLDEIQMAEKLVAKKMRLLQRFSKKKQREKIIMFLKRRGFLWDAIQQVAPEIT